MNRLVSLRDYIRPIFLTTLFNLLNKLTKAGKKPHSFYMLSYFDTPIVKKWQPIKEF